jgi:hypothetical protein
VSPVYREIISIPAWASALLAATFVATGIAMFNLRAAVELGAPEAVWLWDLALGLSLLICAGVPLILGRLEVMVQERDLVLRFGFVPLITKRIPLETILRAEPIRYRPIRQFGGWGLRCGVVKGARTAAFTLRGSTGVLLTLRQPIETFRIRTNRVLVGCDDVVGLASRLRELREQPNASVRPGNRSPVSP